MIHDVNCNFCRVKKLPLYVVENTTMDENSVVDATENTAMDVTENGTVYETKRVTIDGARVVNIFQLEQYINELACHAAKCEKSTGSVVFIEV